MCYAMLRNGTVSFNILAITNVMSLSPTTLRLHNQLNNCNIKYFSISTPSHTIVFQQSRSGLYYDEI